MCRDDNPYRTPDEKSSGFPRRMWKWVRRLAIVGVVVGAAIPLANVLCVFAWMWSRPPAPPGSGYSGTPGVAALFVAVIGCPLLALLFGAIGGLLGWILDLMWPSVACIQNSTSEKTSIMNRFFNNTVLLWLLLLHFLVSAMFCFAVAPVFAESAVNSCVATTFESLGCSENEFQTSSEAEPQVGRSSVTVTERVFIQNSVSFRGRNKWVMAGTSASRVERV